MIVDFFITSAEVIQITGEINQAIYTNMKEAKFNVDPTSVAETGKRLCCTFLKNKYAKLCQIC